MVEWRFTFQSTSNDFSEEVLDGILSTFLDGFGMETGWSLEGVRHAVSRSMILGLLYGDQEKIEGYAFYSVPEEPLLGMHVLWEDAICLRKHVHGNKLTSRSLMEKICSFYPQRTFGWLGGRTQNPLVMLRYSRLGTVFPFDQLYDRGQGIKILEFLLKHIMEVKDSRSVLDLCTGICKGIYPEGRLGDYPIALNGAEKYERLLSEWEFDRDAGDAVVVVSKLYTPISGHQVEVKNAYL